MVAVADQGGARAAGDGALVVAARRGDRDAFGRLFEQYAPMVHGILLARVPADDVGDLVQDVFVVALQKIASLRNQNAFGAWLGMIARNRAMDYHRSTRKTTELPADLGRSDPDRAGAEQALAAIRSLPEAYRETLVLRLVESGPAALRLSLARGTLSAVVSAPPRLFVVDTPAAAAVDLGCAYELHVGDDGAGWIHVTHGAVSLEGDEGRSALVPAGFRCETQARVGPGTPFAADAPAEVRAALHAFDFADGGVPAARALLAAAGSRDGYTLLEILPRVPAPVRREIVERLLHLRPPPPGVDPAGVWNLDGDQIGAWRRDMISNR